MNIATAPSAAATTPTGTGGLAPTTEAQARTDFAAYLGRLAAHGRPDLHTELREAKRQVVNHGGYSILTQALGIERTAIVEAGEIGLMRVTSEGRRFTPADAEDTDNRLSLIVPVWDGLGGNLIDLLAVRTDRPSLFCVRNGYAGCLGEWNAAEVRHATTLWPLPDEVHPSLLLSPNPLTWLRGDCAGACVLHKAYLGSALAGIRSVVAHNERHAKALHKLLTWPDAPKIYLRKKREAA